MERSNLHDYLVQRLNEMPEVELHIEPNTEKPGGIGELCVPHSAKDVCNAIFTLTGNASGGCLFG